MVEFKVVWTKCPTAYNEPRSLFIEAGNEDDAKEIARDHIERTFGVAGWIKFEVSEAKKPPIGRVIA